MEARGRSRQFADRAQCPHTTPTIRSATPGVAGRGAEAAPGAGPARTGGGEDGVHLVSQGGAAGVAGVFDDDEPGAGPGTGELPRGAGAAAEVVAAVNQNTGDAGQLAGLGDQHAVLEETVVREVVRADAHERQLRVVGPVVVRGA